MMPYPSEFGLPCWNKDNAERAIHGAIAQVTKEEASMFLATHSPIKHILDIKTGNGTDEEKAFKNLFSRKGDVRAVVLGKAGTGKSHLIRWISMRAEYASHVAELELDNFKIVMVQRDITGSLKSALKQIVDQLGDEFSDLIDGIKSSINKFSAQTAREELISELYLEISSRWEQRDHRPLPNRLRILGDFLMSPNYRKWLGRDGGTIAQIISRLTENSTSDDREKKIQFSFDELKPPEGTLNEIEDSQQVRDFIELDLGWDSDIAEEIINILNTALVDAQSELTGIQGAKLNDIFTEIRRKLYKQGKQLAVFIEDVTAASGGLDRELFQAFEPREGKDLCRIITLLGMTETSWKVLPDNETDRVSPVYDVDSNAKEWAVNKEDILKFTARYLNAIRMDKHSDIVRLAENRLFQDIPFSACDGCEYLESCHKTFGYVVFEKGVKVGLFPFSKNAPSKLLSSLKHEPLRLAPRGLLDYILDKALHQSYDYFLERTFPDPRPFGVSRQNLTYWSDFENRYLGGSLWSIGSNKNRARFLAEFWLDANSSAKASELLEPLRIPFSLPEFSEKPTQVEEILVEEEEEIKKEDEIKDEEVVEDSILKDYLAKIEGWRNGGKLVGDSDFRDMVYKAIPKMIRWQDYKGTPFKIHKELINSNRTIRIQNQLSNPSSLYFLDLNNDKETSEFLEALVRYEREGKKSWDFETGELHKRRVYRWLRKNRQKILESLEPKPNSRASDAVRTATQLLTLAAILRKRTSSFKDEPQKCINEIFIDVWDKSTRPLCLSDKFLEPIIKDIEERLPKIKDFLVSEIGIGQGKYPPRNFIDPLPILSIVNEFMDKPIINSLPKENKNTFWDKRFADVTKLTAYDNLPKAIDEELRIVKEYIEKLKTFLNECGYGSNLIEEIKNCINQIIELIKIQKVNMPYPPHIAFDNLWHSKRLENNQDVWINSINEAIKIIENPNGLSVLCYDPVPLKQLIVDILVVTKEYLQAIEKQLEKLEDPQVGKNIGTKEALLSELKQISDLLGKGNEV